VGAIIFYRLIGHPYVQPEGLRSMGPWVCLKLLCMQQEAFELMFVFFFCNSHASMLRKEQGIHASFACICSYPHWVPEAGGSRKQARSIRRGDVLKKKKKK